MIPIPSNSAHLIGKYQILANPDTLNCCSRDSKKTQIDVDERSILHFRIASKLIDMDPRVFATWEQS